MKLPKNGKCDSCEDRDDCPMAEMLPKWKDFEKKFGKNYIAKNHIDVYEEYYIETPIIKNGILTWCPMFSPKN